MPDPFEALRTPTVRVDPDPEFASRLRAQVRRVLALPKGATVPETLTAPASAPASATSHDEAGLVPYLIVADARRAIDWYVDALGAASRGSPW